MTFYEHEHMIKVIQKLERENHIIASKTRPEYIQASANTIDTSLDDQGDILSKVESFKEKIQSNKVFNQ